MKTYAYLILAVLVSALLLQPLTEIAMLCKDRLEVGAAITNSVRAAKKECYTYLSMRDLNAEADQDIFKKTFSEIFAASLKLNVLSSTGNKMVFESPSGKFGRFTVECRFTPSRHGDRQRTQIFVESKFEYVFKTKYMQLAKDSIKDECILTHRRYYNMSIAN